MGSTVRLSERGTSGHGFDQAYAINLGAVPMRAYRPGGAKFDATQLRKPGPGSMDAALSSHAPVRSLVRTRHGEFTRNRCSGVELG